MPDDVIITDPWWDLRNPGESEQEQVHAITNEMLRETSPGHALHGMPFAVVGRSDARDDVLLKVDDRWALVHLTWSGKSEVPPWPTCVMFDSASDTQQALALD
ncbi:hypothetical protein SAMN05444365_1164 [Micromonospora pattaloongensis]|uniref:Uncharacterized protein n=1 Tax=Micromonospora pattaloongensis TaxID=405436 RepID=A0A1H3SZ75_9ACTN|nr:hypothetical protein [Micromonospora pattaloongensis]SDZ43224.1 hypothetical protein SAMN05444365_1164 [Micromonospora pattaloongensis]